MTRTSSRDGRRRPRRQPAAWSVELDGELLVMDPTDGVLHELDRLGAVIWSLLDGESPIAELVADLAAAFEVDQTQVEADLWTFIDRLDDAGLLVDAGAPAHVGHNLSAPPPGRVNRRRIPTYLADPPAP